MPATPYSIHYAQGDGVADRVGAPQLFAGESPAVATQDVLLPAGAVAQFVPLMAGYAPWAMPGGENPVAPPVIAVTAYAVPGGTRAAVYTAGCFNIDAIAWPVGTTEAQVQKASETSLLKFRKLLYSDKRTVTTPAPGTSAGPAN